MRRMTRRERLLAVVFGVLLLLVILLQGVAKPLRARLTEINRSLLQQEDVINRAHATMLSLYALEADIETLTAHRRAFIVSEDAIPEMIRKVEEAAAKAHTGHVDIRPLGKEDAEGLTRHRMQLDLRDSFLKMKDFLYYLEEGEPALVIDRVTLDAETQVSNIVRTTVFISAYSISAGETQ